MAKVSTVFMQESPTKLQGNSFSLGVGEWKSFPGGPLGRHRKQIVITNDDNAATRLYVAIGEPESVSAAGRKRAMVVFPQTSITLFTNDVITVFNGTSGQIVTFVGILESFYTGAGDLVV